MGRIFLSAGHGGLERGQYDPGAVVAGVTEAQEMIFLRDFIVQNLRSRGFDVPAVPDDLSLEQSIDWINSRALQGDIALEIHANAASNPTARGAAVYYIGNNALRKTQAEQLLQAYIRRVPQIPSRGAIADTQTGVGSLAFCRWVSVPSLLMEVGLLTNPDDRRLIQSRRQDVAVGIADGLASWSGGGGNPSTPPGTYAVIDININGALYDDKGILVEENAYIPLDLVDRLNVNLPADAPVRRVSYGNVVYVRAVDLRSYNIFVGWDAPTRTAILRSSIGVCTGDIDQIMGKGHASEVELIMFLRSNNPSGLTRFPDLPRLYREEAPVEGVNYDIAFAQMCVETNFLRFGGTTRPEQNNFGGLGDVASGPGGASFPSARIGVRAQIQHLKAYASTEPIVQAIVDPRFRFVRRGVAPKVGQLSGRWTADLQYGEKILNVVRRLYEFTSRSSSR